MNVRITFSYMVLSFFQKSIGNVVMIVMMMILEFVFKSRFLCCVNV